jgi:hypothetical protein
MSGKKKFSIVVISVTVGPSSILSLICDHNKELASSYVYEPDKCVVFAAGSSLFFDKANANANADFTRGQCHELSIINISVTVGPSSILSLICDHEQIITLNKEPAVANSGPFVFEKSSHFFCRRACNRIFVLSFLWSVIRKK